MLMVGGGDKQMIMLNRDLIGKIGGNNWQHRAIILEEKKGTRAPPWETLSTVQPALTLKVYQKLP